MILISLHPYPSTKIFLFVAGLLYLAAISCFADSLFLTANSMPRDQKGARIRAVLFTNAEVSRHKVSLPIVNDWIGDTTDIPWGFNTARRIPSELESNPAANCKAPAFDLTMQASSAGKSTATSSKSQAWLEGAPGDGTYLLGPTI